MERKKVRQRLLQAVLRGLYLGLGGGFFEQLFFSGTSSYRAPSRDGPLLERRKPSSAGRASDAQNLRSDWQKIGGDMRRALDKAKDKDLKMY